MTTKTVKTIQDIRLTDACTLAIAAGTASDYACRAHADGQHATGDALNKLSLRFAELALQELGGEAGQAAADESASA